MVGSPRSDANTTGSHKCYTTHGREDSLEDGGGWAFKHRLARKELKMRWDLGVGGVAGTAEGGSSFRFLPSALLQTRYSSLVAPLVSEEG
ncbi:hypothetical protein PAMP_014838 [Pampus punctatissimus]